MASTSQPVFIDDESSSWESEGSRRAGAAGATGTSSPIDEITLSDSDDSVEIVETPEQQAAARAAAAEARKDTGNAAFREGRFADAVQHYTAAIGLDGSVASFYTNRAAALMGARRFTEALADCERAHSMQSAAPQPKTLLRLARCQLAVGDPSGALETLQELATIEPANAQLYTERSRAERQQGHVVNIERARARGDWGVALLGIDALFRDVEARPRAWRLWRLEALVERGRNEDAIVAGADLLRDNAHDVDALVFRGRAFVATGAHDQALKHFQSALRADPDCTAARTLLRQVKALDALRAAGNAAFKAGRHADAVREYTAALADAPASGAFRAAVLSNRASAHLKLGALDDADADVAACLALDSGYYKALRTRARLHEAREEWDASLADFKAAAELAAGTSDEAGLARDVKGAENALRRSKLKDHYKTLGVKSDATDVEIKKGYRKMSLIHHPDKGGSDEKFKEVNEAYSILSDPERRRKFDMGIDESDPTSGMDPFGGMGGFGGGGFGGGGFGGGGFGGAGGFGGGGYHGGGGFGGGVNLDDLFGQGGGAYSRSRGGYGF